MSQSRGSPYRRRTDLEGGLRQAGDSDDEESSSSTFFIARTKDASIDRLKRWRVCLPFNLILLFCRLSFTFCCCRFNFIDIFSATCSLSLYVWLWIMLIWAVYLGSCVHLSVNIFFSFYFFVKLHFYSHPELGD